MSAKVITVSAIKGGCGKTVNAGCIAYLLAANKKVCMIDGDPQGNLTEMFTQEPVRELRLEGYGGILQAVREKDPQKYIIAMSDNLDLLVGEEIFGTFPDYLYTSFKESKNENRNNIIKKRIIDPIKNDYDYIIIDTAPTLNTTLTNFMTASDYVLGVFETSKFAYSALYTLYETIYMVKEEVNRNLDWLGIIISQIDIRRSDNKEFVTAIREADAFGELCFDTVIHRKAAAGRLSFAGFYGNPELNEALKQFRPLVAEIEDRIDEKKLFLT